MVDISYAPSREQDTQSAKLASLILTVKLSQTHSQGHICSGILWTHIRDTTRKRGEINVTVDLIDVRFELAFVLLP